MSSRARAQGEALRSSNRLPVTAFALLLVALSACSRTQVTAQTSPPPPITFAGEWGTRGGEPGQLSHPEWIATDSRGDVFVADSGSGYIQKFDPTGHPLLAFDDRVPGDPFRLAVDSGAGIYVLGRNADSIFVFSPEGEPFRHYPLLPIKAHQRPESVAVDDAGDIFVIVNEGKSSVAGAIEHSEIRIYNVRGRYKKTLVPPATSGTPFVPASLAAGTDGYVYILDASSTIVQKFTLDGEFVTAWGNPPLTSADASVPHGIGIGVNSKYVFTPDPAHRGILAWSHDGQSRFADSLDYRLQNIGGVFQIAASPRGELLVLDVSGSRVLRFRVNF